MIELSPLFYFQKGVSHPHIVNQIKNILLNIKKG